MSPSASYAPPPVPLLFEKPGLVDVTISPLGSYIAYFGRDPVRKVLNIYLQDRRSAAPSAARQLTHYDNYDAGVWLGFSADERYLLFLREPQLGCEMYHLFSCDLEQEGLRGSPGVDDGDVVVVDCITDPGITCAMDFSGARKQIWTSPAQPNSVVLATGNGRMFWSLSLLRLRENTLTPLVENPGARILDSLEARAYAALLWHAAGLACGIATHLVAHYGTGGLLSRMVGQDRAFWGAPPGLVIQWFVDKELRVRGCMDVSLQANTSTAGALAPAAASGAGVTWLDALLAPCRTLFHKVFGSLPQVHLRLRVCDTHQNNWRTLTCCPQADLNMQILGADHCGEGLGRMDFWEEECSGVEYVDVHVSDVAGGEDTTAYKRYEVASGKVVAVLAGGQGPGAGRENSSGATGHGGAGSEACSGAGALASAPGSPSSPGPTNLRTSDVCGFLNILPFSKFQPTTGGVFFEYDRPRIHLIHPPRHAVAEENSVQRMQALLAMVEGELREGLAGREGKESWKALTLIGFCLHCMLASHRLTLISLTLFGFLLSTSCRQVAFAVHSTTLDATKWIIFAWSDRPLPCANNCPMGWFIFDTAEHKFEFLGAPRPGLAQYANCLGEMRAIEVEGRDGRRCLSFLTIPPKGAREEIAGKRQNTDADSTSRSAKLKIPLVLFPHGGPNFRDHWGYNNLVTLLATRGFAVLQTQVRLLWPVPSDALLIF